MNMDNFRIEKLNDTAPSRLEILAKDSPENNLDVTELDKPIALMLKNDLRFNDASVESKLSSNFEGDEGGEKVYRKIICRNESLESDFHPVTGVYFEKKTIEVQGEIIEGVFPRFDSEHNVSLPDDLYQSSNKEQFEHANEDLKKAIEKDPDLRGKFDDAQLEQISNGDRPDGYVWHHSENIGELQLIDKDIHDKTGHTGGQVIWGGGNENR